MKKRIFQIAKELNISHLEIMSFLKDSGVSVSSHMAPVEKDVYETILNEFSKEKQQIDRLRKEKARQAIVADAFEADTVEVKEEEKSPVEEEKPPKEESVEKTSEIKLKIIKQADTVKSEQKKEKKEESRKEISSNVADKKILKKETKIDKSKLKSIDISSIAEKINKSKKQSSPKKIDSNILNKSLAGNKKQKKKRKEKSVDENAESLTGNTIKVPEYTTVDELSRTMDIPSQEVILKCMEMGMMVTVNQRLDMDSIIMISDEFDFEVEELKDIDESTDMEDDEYLDVEKLSRPPIVTIMGHVDHGKTSLLDFIRNENVVAGESGGITQHIGAYEVALEDDKKITFLDTPGHAAFTAMRSRGANLTDISIIVVAADDSVMPQTIEAINHSQAANVPIIIAINKIDRPEANIDKIKKGLSEQNILVEDWGGKYQCSNISAKTGEGVNELLDKIIIESDMLDLKAPVDCPAKGIVIESRLDKGLGAIATVLIQSGTLKKGDSFLCGTQVSKVREILNERGKKIDSAYPSDPVQILGFTEVPKAGETFKHITNEREAKKIALSRSRIEREAEQRRFKKLTLDQIGKNISMGVTNELDIIVKGDVDGSIEALCDSLMGLSTDEVAVNILHKSVGMITENDVTLAGASNAVIVAFHVGTSPEAASIAKEQGIEIRNYSIIYEAIEEIKLALEGLLEPEEKEEPLGYAEVRDQFKIPKIGIIAGCYVTNGKAVRNAFLRVLRDNEVIHEGKLTSLKRFKDDVGEVQENFECGIGVENFYDFHDKDIIEIYEITKIKRKLK